MINQTILTGHLGGQPEIRTVGSNDTELATFSLAVNIYRGKGKDDDTMWVKAQLWGGMSRWAQGLETGDRVTIQGELREDVWENDEGVERRQIVVDVRGIHTPKRDSTSGERTKGRAKGSRSKGKSKKQKGLPF